MSQHNQSPLVQIIRTLLQMGEKSFALELIDKFEKTAVTFEQFDELAFLYTECKSYHHSIRALEACLAMHANGPALYAVRANLAKVLNHVNDPVQSMIYSRANKSVLPTDLETDLEIAFSHYLLGEYDRSQEIMEALLRNPALSSELRDRARYNLGTYKMESGNFVEGLHDLVTLGHKTGILPTKTLPNVPTWTGYPDVGKTLIILAEGGIGDELIGIRFMHHITSMGMTPIWVTNHKQLESVFQRNGYQCTSNIHTIDVTNALYVQAFYLPVYLGLTEHDVWNGPYLSADVDRVKLWSARLPKKPRIAVKWYGNIEYEQDLHRTIPFEYIKGLCNHGELISLQLEGIDDTSVYDAGSSIHDIEDTLAILSLSDVVVTSCTSVAHMAGALGVVAVVCPPIVCYYCWLGRDDNHSWWYDTNLYVIRQTQHKNWDTVFEQVHVLLDEIL